MISTTAALALALLAGHPSAPDDTLAERIAAAEPGATLEIGPGAFEGRLVLTKDIELVGAGWEETRLFAAELDRGNPAAATITVRGDVEVVLRGLRVGAPAPPRGSDAKGGGVAVSVERGASLTAQDVAVVGPMASGVLVADGATLRMERSLVAAVWRTGIAVASGGTLVLEDSVVRTCYHRCVTLGGDATRSELRRNRISGSAWHGIRYDHAKPLIEGNLIFGNARSGIYASGRTSADVRGNVFWRNEMGGMSCWFDCDDAVTGNAFAWDLRESLSAVGGATPRVTKNLFITDTVAITCSRTQSASELGAPVLEGNRVAGEGSAREGGFLGGDLSEAPGLARVKDGPLTIEFRGEEFEVTPEACAALAAAAPFGEMLPEERDIAPEGETRDWRSWNRTGVPRSELQAAGDPRAYEAGMRRAYTGATDWVEAAMSLGDEDRRVAAIDAIKAAIRSDDVDAIRSGLHALRRVQEVRFERASLAPRALELAEHSDPVVRGLAASAIRVTCDGDATAAKLVELARDTNASVRLAAIGELVWALEKDLTGRGAPEVLAMLGDDVEHDAKRRVLNVLWGAKLSAALEARVIELSREPRIGYDAMYYALSTQANKSRASVERLVEMLADPDTVNVGGRAAWGLGQGVSEAEFPLVATAGLDLVRARGRGRMLDHGLDLVERYARAGERRAIAELIEAVPLLEETEARLRAVLERLKDE